MPSDITLNPEHASLVSRIGDNQEVSFQVPANINPVLAEQQLVDLSVRSSTVQAADVVRRVLVRRLRVKPEKLVDVALTVLQGRGYLGGTRDSPSGDADLVMRLRSALGSRPPRTMPGELVDVGEVAESPPIGS